jgi:hypothetical protein
MQHPCKSVATVIVEAALKTPFRAPPKRLYWNIVIEDGRSITRIVYNKLYVVGAADCERSG